MFGFRSVLGSTEKGNRCQRLLFHICIAIIILFRYCRYRTVNPRGNLIKSQVKSLFTGYVFSSNEQHASSLFYTAGMIVDNHHFIYVNVLLIRCVYRLLHIHDGAEYISPRRFLTFAFRPGRFSFSPVERRPDQIPKHCTERVTVFGLRTAEKKKKNQ